MTKEQLKTKRELLKWYKGIKHNKVCGICGGTFDECQLDFDHIPERGKKFMDISQMVRQSFSKEEIVKEMNKTQLICSNCHRLRTKQRKQKGKGK